jgi:hypothetical protein
LTRRPILCLLTRRQILHSLTLRQILRLLTRHQILRSLTRHHLTEPVRQLSFSLECPAHILKKIERRKKGKIIILNPVYFRPYFCF